MIASMERMPGHDIARAQAVTLDELKPHHALEHRKRARLIDAPGCDIGIAIRTLGQFDAERRDRAPEGVPAERLQPLFHIFPVLEALHPESMPKPDRAMQIVSSKRGSAWV